MRNNRRWMAISATTGLAFFLIANLTDLFVGLNVVSGLIQIVINIFVFVTSCPISGIFIQLGHFQAPIDLQHVLSAFVALHCVILLRMESIT